ncbi:MAG: hypothetical protein ACOCVI_01825 [Planctomycetota bacterium]
MPETEPVPAETADPAGRFKQRLDILLCIVYVVVYAGFVGISVYDVTLMPFGLNLAVFYGPGLIVFALLLAMIYSRACATKEMAAAREADAATSEQEESIGSSPAGKESDA